jgi:hypothetical protein
MHRFRSVFAKPLKRRLRKARAITCQLATYVRATSFRLIPFPKRKTYCQNMAESLRSRHQLGSNALCVLTHQLTPRPRDGSFAQGKGFVDGCEYYGLALFYQNVPAELRHVQRRAKPSGPVVGPGVQRVPRHAHLLRNAVGTDVNAPLNGKRPFQLHISSVVAYLIVASTPGGYRAIVLSLASVRQRLMKAAAL